MPTLSKPETQVVKLLTNLVLMEFDALKAYDAALERLRDTASLEQLTSFRGDHERHLANLAEALRTFGETAPSRGDMKQLLTKGRIVFGGLFGDVAILKGMRMNEDDTNVACREASWHPALPLGIRSMLLRHEGDERRHRAWIDARLEFLDRRAALHDLPTSP